MGCGIVLEQEDADQEGEKPREPFLLLRLMVCWCFAFEPRAVLFFRVFHKIVRVLRRCFQFDRASGGMFD